jgi:anti-anti-sigma factor
MTSSPGNNTTGSASEPPLRSVAGALDGFAHDRLLAELARALQQAAEVYTITVSHGTQFARLELSGEIDAAAEPELTRALEGLDDIRDMPVQVDLSGVTFLDSSGVNPLAEAARRRRDLEQPPLLIAGISRQARRLLTVSGLGTGPQLDILSWDSLLDGAAARRREPKT